MGGNGGGAKRQPSSRWVVRSSVRGPEDEGEEMGREGDMGATLLRPVRERDVTSGEKRGEGRGRSPRERRRKGEGKLQLGKRRVGCQRHRKNACDV